MSATDAPRRVVIALGAAQTLAWASSYYLPAVLADPVAASLGVSRVWFFGAFSAALLLMGMLGPALGRHIDAHGGRRTLMTSNGVLAAGLVALAAAQGPVSLALAWVALGAGMALGLYETAFATLAHLYGARARLPITGITLMAGFASTLGWPLTAALEHAMGWRGACLVWAALHLVIGLPLNALLPRRAAHGGETTGGSAHRGAATGGAARGGVATETADVAIAAGAPVASGATAPDVVVAATVRAGRRAMVIVAAVFAAVSYVSTAMAAHLPRLLQETGATAAVAIAAASLVGPAQVAARFVEFAIARRFAPHPLAPARVAAALHPVGAGLLALIGGAGIGAPAFALLHGAGNGMMTIARGTLPLALFGAEGYGFRQGAISAASRIVQAAAPVSFGLLLDAGGAPAALALSAGLSLAALVALFALRR
jgi:MFS family permease